VQAVALEGPAYQAPAASLLDLKRSESVSLDLRVWRMSSYSSLLRGQGPERDVHDGTRDPELPGQAGPDVPLADFVQGAEAGECLHQLLEVWDFRAIRPDLVRRILERNGLGGPEATPKSAAPASKDAVQTVADFLPELAGAVIPGLGALSEVAQEASLSEWHFVLPLGHQGVDGEALSTVFAKHPDARVRAYAASLKHLAPQSVNGMLQGYIDRLVRKGPLWAVVDWKSNHLGKKAGDYSQEALWACAADSHYILQVHLYLAALRRHLGRRGGGNSIHGAALAFLRGMRARTSDGILYFPAEEAFMDRLDGLFLGSKP
jgi:exodeoxyribonuclease V beta subunit